jgi:hypothetical protein
MICNTASRHVLIKPGQLKIWQMGQEGPTRVMASTVVHRSSRIGATLDQGKGCENKLTNQPTDLGLKGVTQLVQIQLKVVHCTPRAQSPAVAAVITAELGSTLHESRHS